MNISVDSKIMDKNLLAKLYRVCKISPNINLVRLFQAAGKDFKAADFHMICDNFRKTLVLIKSDCDSVFGGYTEKEWNTIGKTFIFR